MVRTALRSKRRIGSGPVPGVRYVPAISVLLGSLLAGLPIITQNGWIPSFGFITLLAWRLLRSDAFPAWWAAPLGLFNDCVTGSPIGFSVSLWTASMLALDIADRRTQFRDYWIEWALAALLIVMSEWAQWQIAKVVGAPVPFGTIIPPLLIAIAAFPLFAWLVSRIDRWRLGRA